MFFFAYDLVIINAMFYQIKIAHDKDTEGLKPTSYEQSICVTLLCHVIYELQNYLPDTNISVLL